MLFALTFNTWMLATIALAAVAAYLLSKAATRKFLRIDDKIDDRQEVWSRLGGLLEAMHLPKVANIFYKFGAINVDEAIMAMRSLVNLITDGGPALVLKELHDNFFKYQMPERLKLSEDRAEIVAAVLANPDAKAEISAVLEEEN